VPLQVSIPAFVVQTGAAALAAGTETSAIEATRTAAAVVAIDLRIDSFI
jgi:hypothetical protein